MRGVCLIQVPYHAGDERHPSAAGPADLVAAGAARVFEERGLDTSVEVVDRGARFRDTASSSADVNRGLARTVAAAVADGRTPIVLSGSCSVAPGVLAGFEHSRCGAVWLDAHADFNTPESTASGFFAGMSLAIVTGYCWVDYWRSIGDSTPLAEERIALLGIRELSPEAERRRLEQSAIRAVGWRDGVPTRDVEEALAAVRERADRVYLHVDFDVFAPEVAPGTADDPVPGGLSLDDALAIVRGCGGLAAVTLATYTPSHDADGSTRRLALTLLDTLAERIATGS
jgi:arginase